MAFFDEAGRKIKEAGQDVAQTTRNLTSTMKLNSAIAEDEKNIARLYCAIGQEYFDLHGDDPEEALAARVESIKAAKAHIEECKAQLLKIKGHMLCPSCGEEISDESVFCNFCGVKLPEKAPKHEEEPSPAPQEAEKPLICPECGAAYKEGSKYCIICGRLIDAQPVKKPEEAPAYPSYCLHCGAAIPAGESVCPACGRGIPGQEEPAGKEKPYPTMKASDRTDGKPFPTFVASERAESGPAEAAVEEAVEEVKEAAEETVEEVKEAAEEVFENVKASAEGIMEAPPAAPAPDLGVLYEKTVEEAKEAVEAHGAPMTEDEIKHYIAEEGQKLKETVKPADDIYDKICGGPESCPQDTIFPMSNAFGKPCHPVDGPGSIAPYDKKCPECGAALKRGQNFCVMCGARVAPPEDPNVLKCAFCGAELTPGKKFCHVCGTRVNG